MKMIETFLMMLTTGLNIAFTMSLQTLALILSHLQQKNLKVSQCEIFEKYQDDFLALLLLQSQFIKCNYLMSGMYQPCPDISGLYNTRHSTVICRATTIGNKIHPLMCCFIEETKAEHLCLDPAPVYTVTYSNTAGNVDDDNQKQFENMSSGITSPPPQCEQFYRFSC